MLKIPVNRDSKQFGPEIPDHFEVDLEAMDLQVFGMDRQVLRHQLPGIKHIDILLGNVFLLLNLVAPVGHSFLPVKQVMQAQVVIRTGFPDLFDPLFVMRHRKSPANLYQ